MAHCANATGKLSAIDPQIYGAFIIFIAVVCFGCCMAVLILIWFNPNQVWQVFIAYIHSTLTILFNEVMAHCSNATGKLSAIDPQIYGAFIIFIAVVCFGCCMAVLILIIHRKLYKRVPINILICSITVTDAVMIIVYFCIGIMITRSNTPTNYTDCHSHHEHISTWNTLLGACEEFAYQNQYLHHLVLALTRLVHFTCKPQLEKIVRFQLNTKRCYAGLTCIVWGVNSVLFLIYTCTVRPQQGQFYDSHKLGWNYVDTQTLEFKAYWNCIQSFSMVIAFGSYAALFVIIRAKRIPLNIASPQRGLRRQKLEYRILLILMAMLVTQLINSVYWQLCWTYIAFFPLTEMLSSVVGSILYLILVEDAACCEVSIDVLWKPRQVNISSDDPELEA